MRQSEFTRIIRDLEAGQPSDLTVRTDEGEVRRAFDPPERLILLGGGHVSLALARFAAMLDFTVTVADDRIAFANSERFPMAEQVICDDFAHAIVTLKISGSDYVCILTRGHRWDTLCVEKILSGAVMPRYLGMIGSKRRVAGMRDLLVEAGYDPKRIDRLHAPIGLKIGAVTPEEIAVSICAELIQCRREIPANTAGGTLLQRNTDRRMLDYLAYSEEPRAMLLVLSADGSTPVRSGAMMAVNATGKGYGTVGGGCSEAAAIAAARRVIGTGRRRILPFDMSDEVAADSGMVCGGNMQILIEDITM